MARTVVETRLTRLAGVVRQYKPVALGASRSMETASAEAVSEDVANFADRVDIDQHGFRQKLPFTRLEDSPRECIARRSTAVLQLSRRDLRRALEAKENVTQKILKKAPDAQNVRSFAFRR